MSKRVLDLNALAFNFRVKNGVWGRFIATALSWRGFGREKVQERLEVPALFRALVLAQGLESCALS